MHDRIPKLSLQEMCGNISSVKSYCSGIRKKKIQRAHSFILSYTTGTRKNAYIAYF